MDKNVELYFSESHLTQTIFPFGIPNHMIILPQIRPPIVQGRSVGMPFLSLAVNNARLT